LIDFLVNRARSFIFSTAPVPAAAAAAAAGIRFIQSNEGQQRCRRLWERVAQCRAGILPAPDRLEAGPALSAILPVIIGDETRAVATSAALRERDIFVPAIRYPTVARGAARLRVTVTATHTTEEINLLATALNEIVNRKS